MTQVNFYILPHADNHTREAFVYRLVDKALENAGRTVIICADDEQCTRLSDLLWGKEPERLIAHELLLSAADLHPPYPLVVLTRPASSESNNQETIAKDNEMNSIQALIDQFSANVVIDLSYEGNVLSADKILLVANQHPEILANARMKYQTYVEEGIKPAVYKIGQSN